MWFVLEISNFILQFQYGDPPPTPSQTYFKRPFPIERPFLFFSATI